jgi:hypothetical protein
VFIEHFDFAFPITYAGRSFRGTDGRMTMWGTITAEGNLGVTWAYRDPLASGQGGGTLSPIAP